MRFSLRTLLIVTAVIAFFAFVLSNPSELLFRLLELAIYILWLFSVAAAIATTGARRCFWAAFAITFCFHPYVKVAAYPIEQLNIEFFSLLPERLRTLSMINEYGDMSFQLLAAIVAGAFAAILYRRSNNPK